MADSHSTPDSDQSGTERSVIVGYRPNVFDKSTPNSIVLMVYGEQEQRLQDELQEANQKLKRIESTLATLQ